MVIGRLLELGGVERADSQLIEISIPLLITMWTAGGQKQSDDRHFFA
jgi:hypothetical protein